MNTTTMFAATAALAALLFAAPSALAAGPAADSAPMRLDLRESPRLAADGETFALAYSPRWAGASSCSIAADGTRLLSNATDAGTLSWTARGVGRHALSFTAGSLSYEAAFTVLGDDAVAIDGGRLQSNAIWASGKTWVVTAPLTVPSGVTLTIEPGAVVKFMDGAGLAVESGGACIARGVVFTHVADDTAGGDTMMDGDGGDGSPGTARPTMGAYAITGVVTDDDATEYRYMPPQLLTSSITSDTRLRGHRCYIVSNSVTVASGATLTLQPGTILKFNTGCQMTVNGTLSAQGTRAAPIVFTSLKDDAHGGDTNGDGGKTYAQPGDWYQIRVSGTAAFDHCSVLYNASSENYGGLEAYGGTVTFDNGEIAHCKYECVNAHSSGTFTARNTAFWDGSLGFGYYGGSNVQAINCVFYGLTTAIRQSGKQLVNCVFSDCKSFTDQGGDGSTFDHCVFWNPAGFGAQSYSKVGQNGNLWGDPLFLDPEGGDFRIAANSPCVDAADSAAAPEVDFYGQPRMDVKRVKDVGVPNADGVCADIGLYEVPGTASVPLPDLAVLGVGVPAGGTIRAGDEIEISYVVTNRGPAAATGLVRDAFRLVGADAATAGLVVEAGEAEQTYALAPGGAAATLRARLRLPAARPGAWRVVVDANPQRDVFEQNLANNRAWSDATVELSLDSLSMGTATVAISSGETAGFALADLPVSGGAVVVSGFGNARLSAFGDNGALPGAGGGSTAVTLPDGTLLVVFPSREEGDVAFLSLVNEGSAPATATVDVRPAGLSLLAVSPTRAPNGGEVVLTLYGTGLSAVTAATLGGRAAVKTEVVDAARILATFDASGSPAGTASVSVRAGAASASLPGAVELYAAKTGPKLEAWLETPSAVRDGRVFTAWVRYRNAGDGPLDLPLFKVSCADSSTKIGLSSGVLPSARTLYVAGLAPDSPAGVLPPGAEGAVPFFFQPFGTYRLELAHVSEAEAAVAFPDFGGVAGYRAAIAGAATRLALRGRPVADLHELSNFALLEKAGAPVSAISGFVRRAADRSPVANLAVFAVNEETGTTSAEGETDAEGWFSLSGLPAGAYRLALSGSSLLVAPTGAVEVVSGCDRNGLSLLADAGGTIRGTVVSAGGVPVAGVAVRLLDEAGTPCAETETDEYGAFAFPGVCNGVYSAVVSASGTQGAAIEEGIGIDNAEREAIVALALPAAGEVRGTVSENGVPVSGGKVQIVREDGASLETVCGEDGTFRLQGVPAGSWDLRYHDPSRVSDDVPVDLADGETLSADLAVHPRPLFEPLLSHGYGSLETRFLFVDAERAQGITDWAWDLDGDGVVDSNEASPSFTYAKPGTYDAELRFMEGGTNVTVRREACVQVDASVPVQYRDGAIVAGHNAGTLVVVSAEENTLSLRGVAEIPLAAGGALLLQDADGEWILRKIVSVSGDAASGWTVGTEEGTLRDVYRRFAFSGLVEVPVSTEEEQVRPVRTRAAEAASSAARRAASDGGSPLKGFAEGGVYGSVTVQPNLHFVLDIDIDEETGKDYARKAALVGSVTLQLTGGWRGALGANLEIPVKLPTPPIPTPVPGCTLEVLCGTKLVVRATGEGSGEWNGGVDVGVQIGVERGGDGKYHWLPPVEFSPFGTSSADFSGKVEVSLEEELGLKARLAGVMSLVLSNVNGIRFEAKAATTSPPSLELYADAGVHAEANLVDIDLKFWNFRLGADFDAKKKLSIGYWEGPTPDFSFTQSGDGGKTVAFHDKSDGGYWKWLGGPKVSYPVRGWEWDFAGMGSSGGQNPVFTFPGKGKYRVSLRALGSSVSGPNRKRKSISVGEPDDVPEDEEAPYDPPDDSESGKSVQSWDPNEMAGPEGQGSERALKPGEWATYTIYFENHAGDDVADAQEVRVSAALDPSLDWTTFEMSEVAFGDNIDVGLSGKSSGSSEISLPGTERSVRTALSFDLETGSAQWYLRIFDPNGMFGWPADDSGFLPPNDPETHCGEGHITYRVKVREDAEPGARIDASATIVFDYNDPIETDPAWWNTVATRGRAGYLDPGSSFWGVGFGTPDAPLGHGDYVAQNGLQGIETTANADGTSTHHVLGAGDPSDLQRAIDGASPGDTILVGPGCYGPVRVTRNRLSILSTDGRQRTYVNGLYAATCVDMRGTSGCRIDGFTLVQGLGPNGGGIAGGSAADCLVAGCRAAGDGGGAWNAALTDCVLDANVAGGAGGGAFGGSLNRCEVRGNSAATRGGGIASASATGCLLAGNRAPYGGGAHGATLMNCTVADNVAGVSGGGTWGGTTRNSIVVSNALASGAAANWAGSSTFQHTCTTPIPKGAGNFHAAPRFVGQETGNYHLSNYSKCRDRGNRNLTRAPYDLAGLDRVMGANIDVGCYEYATQVTPLDAADYDGDGVPDIGFYNPATTTWFLRQTTDGTVRREKLGAAGITVVPRDYDGDGIRDPATYNPANGTWQILPSATGAVATRKLGWKGITLVDAADCDGDGRADPIIFNPASKTWQVLRSSDGGTTVVPNFGWAGIKPVCGDYDGDGIAELAFYSPTSGTWYVRRWDGTQRTLKLGKAGVRVSPLDADFDGALDPCHFDPATGTWTWRSLVTGEGGTAKFGDSTVSPHPFDWDGDGVPDTFGFYSPYRAGFLDLFLEADGTRRAYMTNF